MSDFTSMLKISVGRDYFRTLYPVFLWFKSLCLFEVWCSVVQSFAKIKFSSFIFQKYFDFLQPTRHGYAKSLKNIPKLF